MAKIKKLRYDNKTYYPLTIPQAVIDPDTGKSVKDMFNQINEDVWYISTKKTGK